MNNFVAHAYRALLHFLTRYRRTALGPAWMLVGPSLFIAFLGILYAEIGAADPAAFIPHMASGLIFWTLIASFVTGAATVNQRNRAQILQTGQSLDDIVAVEVIKIVLTFLHQIPIIVAVFFIYGIVPSFYSLTSFIGLGLIIANGVWVTQVFGILGARYRDLSEVFQAVMRISFLATPIIWMPGDSGRGSVMGAFLTFNPFHHFLEIVRAPLLGNSIAPLSWAVAIGFTVVGFALARVMTARYARFVPLWV